MVPSKVDYICQAVPHRPGDVSYHSSWSSVYSLNFPQQQDPLDPRQRVEEVLKIFEGASQEQPTNFRVNYSDIFDTSFFFDVFFC